MLTGIVRAIRPSGVIVEVPAGVMFFRSDTGQGYIVDNNWELIVDLPSTAIPVSKGEFSSLFNFKKAGVGLPMYEICRRLLLQDLSYHPATDVPQSPPQQSSPHTMPRILNLGYSQTGNTRALLSADTTGVVTKVGRQSWIDAHQVSQCGPREPPAAGGV